MTQENIPYTTDEIKAMVKTIEELRKKYNEALERARAINDGKDVDAETGTTTCEYIFPELKVTESEDEKIRKTLIGWVNIEPQESFGNGFTKEEILAWLEKQKLNTSKREIDDAYLQGICDAKHEIEKQGEQPTDKIEPKFKVGDWITDDDYDGDYTWKIVEVKPLDYILQSQDGNIVDDTISYVDEQFHLWSINDAKDGDVLTYKNDDVEWILIYKNIIPESRDVPHDILRYHALFTGTNFHDSGIAAMIGENYASCFTPATKEQRDLLFAKM